MRDIGFDECRSFKSFQFDTIWVEISGPILEWRRPCPPWYPIKTGRLSLSFERVGADCPNLVGAPNYAASHYTQPRLWLNAKCSSEFWPFFLVFLSRLSALNWFSILVRLPRNFFLFDCAKKTPKNYTATFTCKNHRHIQLADYQGPTLPFILSELQSNCNIHTSP